MDDTSIVYNKYMRRVGEVFTPSCEDRKFLCDGKKQKTRSKSCPNVEFRFACPPDGNVFFLYLYLWYVVYIIRSASYIYYILW